MVYASKSGMLRALLSDKQYEIIAEVYDGDRRLVAGLFKKRRAA